MMEPNDLHNTFYNHLTSKSLISSQVQFSISFWKCVQQTFSLERRRTFFVNKQLTTQHDAFQFDLGMALCVNNQEMVQ